METPGFFEKLLFVRISAVSEDSPLPEILVEDADCDAFEIFAWLGGRRDSTNATLKTLFYTRLMTVSSAPETKAKQQCSGTIAGNWPRTWRQ